MQLKDRLKKDDLVVCIFHDHGSRYVAKIYNDQWMMERGFLDVKSFKDIISGRPAGNRLITAEAAQTVSEAVELMKRYDIESIPVFKDGDMIGSISESGLFQKLFSNTELKHERIEQVLEPAFPVVDFNTPIEKLKSLLNKDNGAVMSRDEAGNYHIITKYDVLQALGS